MGTRVNQYEDGKYRMYLNWSIENKIEWSEWSGTKVENRIEIETEKQQVTVAHNNNIVGHESKSKSQGWIQTRDSSPYKIPIFSLKKL